MVRRIIGIVVVVIVLVYIAGFFRSDEINTSIKIDAPPDQVWEVLTDLGSYRDWNPFLTQASGRVNENAHLRITIAPVEEGGEPMLFQPTILTVEDSEELVWRGRVLIPGIFDGTHSFQLEETDDGGTQLTHSETFSGVLLFVTDVDQYEPLFVKMNEALKERAEAMAAAAAEGAEGEGPRELIQPNVGDIFNMTGNSERLSGAAPAEEPAAEPEGTMTEEGAAATEGMMQDGAAEADTMMQEATPPAVGSSGSGNLFDVGRQTPSTPPLESGSNPR